MTTLTDPLDDQPFYELMQAYRHAPITDPAGTVAAFEAVKDFIRTGFAAGRESVPREPTRAMLDAGVIVMSVTGGTLDADVSAMWQAMYDAAQPAAQGRRGLYDGAHLWPLPDGYDQSGDMAQSTGSGEQARTDHNAEQLSRCPPDHYADLLPYLDKAALYDGFQQPHIAEMTLFAKAAAAIRALEAENAKRANSEMAYHVALKRAEADAKALRDALRELVGQLTNIEVLGEWSALDMNITTSKKVRAKVDAIEAAARALLKGMP